MGDVDLSNTSHLCISVVDKNFKRNKVDNKIEYFITLQTPNNTIKRSLYAIFCGGGGENAPYGWQFSTTFKFDIEPNGNDEKLKESTKPKSKFSRDSKCSYTDIWSQ